MGWSSFSSGDWESYRSSTAGQSRAQLFTATQARNTGSAKDSFDPKIIKVRESRDSAANPQSTPIIIAFDQTGSMGDIPHAFVTEGLGVLFKEIYDRKPVTDPHLLCMAVGDAFSDTTPLQVTQFESDIRLASQITDLYLEGNGGGNGGESYLLAHYFAAFKTSTDAFEKRGQKGLLFTIGDEPPHAKLTAQQIKRITGDQVERDYTAKELADLVSQQYDVFHIVIEQGSGLGQYGHDRVYGEWKNLLGAERVIKLTDYTKLAEVVVSTLQALGGIDHATVANSWGTPGTSLVVADAIKGVVAKRGTTSPTRGAGPVRFGSGGTAAPMVA